MIQIFRLSFLAIMISVMFIACDKDEPEIQNEEELITTINYQLTPLDGGPSVNFNFVDLDGDGGNDPVITGGVLRSNTFYNGSLTLLNEAETPSEDITEEIDEEAIDHQFFFSSTVGGLNFAYDDLDTDGNPVGLKSILSTGNPGMGTMTVILRHEPNKSASGVSIGNITNAGGETDIEVTFPLSVE